MIVPSSSPRPLTALVAFERAVVVSVRVLCEGMSLVLMTASTPMQPRGGNCGEAVSFRADQSITVGDSPAAVVIEIQRSQCRRRGYIEAGERKGVYVVARIADAKEAGDLIVRCDDFRRGSFVRRDNQSRNGKHRNGDSRRNSRVVPPASSE